MKLCVVYYDEELVVREFTGEFLNEEYIEFDDCVCGWYGISVSNLCKMTEDKVFCLSTQQMIKEAKETLMHYFEDRVEYLEDELQDMNKILDEIEEDINGSV